MRTRRLGRTGFVISEIGFGAWGLGGNLWRGVPDETALAAVQTAFDHGVTFFDTALVYGVGHSERLIAKALARQAGGAGVVVATKIPPRDGVWPGRATTPLRQVFPARHVIECVEKSLRNLETGALDLEQLHVWHDAWLDDPDWQETRAAMTQLKEQRKVLHWGVSVNDHAPGTALRLLRDPLIETAQVIYNIHDRSPERELFALCRQQDLGVIARVPFDEGILTGAIGPATVFSEGDWRERYFRDDRKSIAAERAAALGRLLGSEAQTLPELALRFCLSRDEVGTVIPGMRRPEHVRANTAVSDGRRLSPEMLGRLEELAWDKNWYE